MQLIKLLPLVVYLGSAAAAPVNSDTGAGADSGLVAGPGLTAIQNSRVFNRPSEAYQLLRTSQPHNTERSETYETEACDDEDDDDNSDDKDNEDDKEGHHSFDERAFETDGAKLHARGALGALATGVSVANGAMGAAEMPQVQEALTGVVDKIKGWFQRDLGSLGGFQPVQALSAPHAAALEARGALGGFATGISVLKRAMGAAEMPQVQEALTGVADKFKEHFARSLAAVQELENQHRELEARGKLTNVATAAGGISALTGIITELIPKMFGGGDEEQNPEARGLPELSLEERSQLSNAAAAAGGINPLAGIVTELLPQMVNGDEQQNAARGLPVLSLEERGKLTNVATAAGGISALTGIFTELLPQMLGGGDEQNNQARGLFADDSYISEEEVEKLLKQYPEDRALLGLDKRGKFERFKDLGSLGFSTYSTLNNIFPDAVDKVTDGVQNLVSRDVAEQNLDERAGSFERVKDIGSLGISAYSTLDRLFPDAMDKVKDGVSGLFSRDIEEQQRALDELLAKRGKPGQKTDMLEDAANSARVVYGAGSIADKLPGFIDTMRDIFSRDLQERGTLGDMSRQSYGTAEIADPNDLMEMFKGFSRDLQERGTLGDVSRQSYGTADIADPNDLMEIFKGMKGGDASDVLHKRDDDEDEDEDDDDDDDDEKKGTKTKMLENGADAARLVYGLGSIGDRLPGFIDTMQGIFSRDLQDRGVSMAPGLTDTLRPFLNGGVFGAHFPASAHHKRASKPGGPKTEMLENAANSARVVYGAGSIADKLPGFIDTMRDIFSRDLQERGIADDDLVRRGPGLTFSPEDTQMLVDMWNKSKATGRAVTGQEVLDDRKNQQKRSVLDFKFTPEETQAFVDMWNLSKETGGPVSWNDVRPGDQQSLQKRGFAETLQGWEKEWAKKLGGGVSARDLSALGNEEMAKRFLPALIGGAGIIDELFPEALPKLKELGGQAVDEIKEHISRDLDHEEMAKRFLPALIGGAGIIDELFPEAFPKLKELGGQAVDEIKEHVTRDVDNEEMQKRFLGALSFPLMLPEFAEKIADGFQEHVTRDVDNEEMQKRFVAALALPFMLPDIAEKIADGFKEHISRDLGAVTDSAL